MDYNELARRLGEISKRMFSLPEYTRMLDANRGEGVLLSYLRQHGDVTPAELSRALNVSTARIAALLNRMERNGLVVRNRHPRNNKNTIVTLLPAGTELHERLQKAFTDSVTGFLERLGEERAALFVELQGELADYMSENNRQEKDK